MEEQRLNDPEEGLHWLTPELPLQLDFECERTVRRVAELNPEQIRELAAATLRHNFRLVHLLRQSIDRVDYLEDVIDDLCEEITN